MNCKVYINHSILEFKILHVLNPQCCSFYDRYNADTYENAMKYEYYYLHPKMNVEYGLPDNSVIIESTKDNIKLLPNIQGVIFDNLPNLPDKYKEIVEYWNSKLSYEAESMDYADRMLDHAIFYYTNALALKSKDSVYKDVNHYATSQDPNKLPKLLTDSYVMTIVNLSKLIPDSYIPNTFIKVDIPIDEELLGMEGPSPYEDSYLKYNLNSERTMTIYLKVEDIINSPDPDCIHLNILRYEALDYGYIF